MSLRVVALGALLFFVFSVVAVFREPAAGFFWRVASPVFSARDALWGGEAAHLRAELASAQALIADRNYLYQENLELKIRLQRNAEREVVLAGVVAHPPTTPYDTLIIDAGETEGIEVGNLVSAGGSLLIGEVEQVYPTTARVVLFSAPGWSHEALLYLRSNQTAPLTLEGQGAGAFIARVPVGTHASLGDAIVLPGVSGGFFAAVSAIEATEGEPFEILHLHVPVSPFALRYVEVWRGAGI